MNRIEPLTIEKAQGAALRALRSPVGHMRLFGVLAHAGGCVVPIMKLGGAILSEQQLDARSRELMVLVALRVSRGRYEWPQHVDIGLDTGITPEEIRAIEELDLEGSFDVRDRALLAFAKAVATDGQMDEATFAQARAHLGECETVEAIIAIGFYQMLARFTETLDMEPDPIQGRAVIGSLQR